MSNSTSTDSAKSSGSDEPDPEGLDSLTKVMYYPEYGLELVDNTLLVQKIFGDKLMTTEKLKATPEWNKHLEHIKKTEIEIFDLEDFPKFRCLRRYEPMNVNSASITYRAEDAIEYYNKKEGSNYQFVKVLKGVSSSLSQFITFEAKNKDSTKTFQTNIDRNARYCTAEVKYTIVKGDPIPNE